MLPEQFKCSHHQVVGLFIELVEPCVNQLDIDLPHCGSLACERSRTYTYW
jgi:hypothetical protein